MEGLAVKCTDPESGPADRDIVAEDAGGSNGLAETAGLMSTMARRGGGQQMKIRGLRELFGSLKINYDAAVKAASVAEAEAEDEKP